MHVGFGWAKPWLPHALDGPVTLSTSCWSIWPTFSGNVMAPSRAFTRAWIGLSASSHGVLGELAASAKPWARKADSPPATKTPTATAMTAFRRPRTRPLQYKFDMTRPPWVGDQRVGAETRFCPQSGRFNLQGWRHHVWRRMTPKGRGV